jgi:DNA segregation ATPase FtsK/SpoIIIE-like protein
MVSKRRFKTLEDVAGSETDRKLVIHIEECDMVYRDRARMEAALDRLMAMGNILVVYSTSRPDPGYLADWVRRYIDMRVVFAVSSEVDSRLSCR